MKSVLVSTRPKWCEKICHEIGKTENGKPIYEKRIEVRKTAPKKVPFKAYIYETKYATETPWVDEDGHFIYKGRGQVIGEFICEKISIYAHLKNLTSFNDIGLPCGKYDSYAIWTDEFKEMCLTWTEIENYGKSKTLYGWRISDLKIYDKPKELSEFNRPCSYAGLCFSCDRAKFTSKGDRVCEAMLTRPPQSWCYVEELK